MRRQRQDALFSTYDFGFQLSGTRDAAIKELNSIEGDKFLNMAPAALVDYLADKYKVGVPVLDESRISVEQQEGSVRVDRFTYDVDEVPGTLFLYYIPFEGEAAIFQSRGSQFHLSNPRGEVIATELRLTYPAAPDEASQTIKQRFDRDLGAVKQNLEWMRGDAARHNAGLQAVIEAAVDARRQKLLNDRQQVAALGYPLRDRGTTPTYTVPTVRPKPKVQRPSTGSAPFKPEPVLDMAEYQRILELMAGVARAMELSPSAFRNLDEEDLRTHFLVQLNGQYQGQASGETFNLAGKTDIIIREGERNIFIAECKFWTGSQGLTKAIDQLLGYTSWRDTKTAILLFNRGRQLSTILPKIPETTKQHRFCRKQLDYASETGFRFVFQHPDDSGRELTLTILAFEVPQ